MVTVGVTVRVGHGMEVMRNGSGGARCGDRVDVTVTVRHGVETGCQCVAPTVVHTMEAGWNSNGGPRPGDRV